MSAINTTCEVQTPQKQHEFPKFIDQMVRLQTFGGWPETSKKKPEQLAHAGFFFNQADDRVICFSCGTHKSTKWRIRDDPWKEHALWCKGSCDYLTMVKGSDYIATACEDYRTKRSWAIYKQLQREQLREQNRLVAAMEKDKIINPLI